MRHRDDEEEREPVCHYQHGIYYVKEPGKQLLAQTLTINGEEYHRFMDYIYIPHNTEYLTEPQLRAVNELRASLIKQSRISSANKHVKERFFRVVKLLKRGTLLEWGCGYHSMSSYMSSPISYIAVDVDPKVVAYQREKGLQCFLADQVSWRIASKTIDVIMSAFVFHFAIPDVHIAEMKRILTSNGFILANVYRRDQTSRQQLKRSFEREGFGIVTKPDCDAICKDHEYWLIYTCMQRDYMQKVLGMV